MKCKIKRLSVAVVVEDKCGEEASSHAYIYLSHKVLVRVDTGTYRNVAEHPRKLTCITTSTLQLYGHTYWKRFL